VTEEAALVVVMMLAGRRLLVAGRVAGHDRTFCRRGESIGLTRPPGAKTCTRRASRNSGKAGGLPEVPHPHKALARSGDGNEHGIIFTATTL
jgi:hypothetical protein